MSLPAGRYVSVAKVGEIPDGGVKVVRLGDQDIAIYHIDGGYHAIDDICPHDGGELASGVLEGTVVECPRHGSRFDVRTGAVLTLPAVSPVTSYDVRLKDGEIQVAWAGAGPAPVASGAAATPGGGASVAPAAASAPNAAPASAAPAAAGAPSQQELAIRSALETVMDPEINLSVIDLGLIREIQIQPQRTHIRMMLTTPFCPYAPQMIADVKAATQSVVPQECEVEIMPDPWSPELMPDPGLLGYTF